MNANRNIYRRLLYIKRSLTNTCTSRRKFNRQNLPIVELTHKPMLLSQFNSTGRLPVVFKDTFVEFSVGALIGYEIKEKYLTAKSHCFGFSNTNPQLKEGPPYILLVRVFSTPGKLEEPQST